ncbi:MAG: endolytic transglycosylase MltG [Ruminococcaceae bacterium]|nr:endolytic transglycosylase MltG [Oscillospiraceae bacterium]
MNNETKNPILETNPAEAEETKKISWEPAEWVGEKKKSKKKGPIIFLALLLILAIVAFAILPVGEFLEFDKGEGTKVTVEIPQGASADKVADILLEKGVIESKFAFKLKLRFHEKGNELKYGTYNLDTAMTLSAVIDELATGHQEGKLITIPEGYSAEMIAALCEKNGICTKEEFLDVLANETFEYDFLKYIPDNDEIKYKLQGFLFPDTYEYTATTTPKDFINNMLKNYEKNVVIPDDRELAYYEILTLASVVEREAKMDDERAKIAGVFMNRLDIDMPLQACATVIYAKSEGAYDMEEVLFSDLEVQSPYNTYKNPGLPVGPICNPGKLAIEAVLNPESHSYLYYHTDEGKKDGSHIFTESYNEHSATQTYSKSGEAKN